MDATEVLPALVSAVASYTASCLMQAGRTRQPGSFSGPFTA